VALTFPALPDVVFERAPLLVVLTQIRFPPILSLLAEPGVVGFQEAIRDDYGQMVKVDESGVLLGPSGVQTERHAPIWKFTPDGNEDWVVSLSVDFVSFETPEYTHADDFIRRFNRVLDALDRTVHPASSTRIGLRKVNDITAPAPVTHTSGWREFLNPSLLGISGEEPLAPYVVETRNHARLRDENGDELAILHGLVGDNLGQYRLDLDYYSERPLEIRASSELSELLRTFAASETEFFMWALDPAFRETFGPISRPKEGTEYDNSP